MVESTNGVVGSVAGLWRFPVKSMGGEQIDEVEISGQGLVGDRAFALVDEDTGKVVTGRDVRLFPDLLGCRAAFVEPPRSDHDLPPVCITLQGGQAVTSDSGNADRLLSEHFRREVTLVRSAPAAFTIEQSAFLAKVGVSSSVAAGSLLDAFPVTVLTTSSLTQMAALQPESRFDTRRFRMNVIVGTREPGFLENAWIGRELALGDTVKLKVTLPDPRCVMTTLAQDDLGHDPEILRSLARHNRLPVGPAGLLPCAGVYAVVNAPGTMRARDRVMLT